MVFSLRSFLIRGQRNRPLSMSDMELPRSEQADARELKRIRDELRLAREHVRAQAVLFRNRIL